MPGPPSRRAGDGGAGDPLEGDGLSLAYASLERLRRVHELDRLTVAVEVPQLGRQLLTVPRGALPGALGSSRVWAAEPEVDAPGAELELAVALCRLALRSPSGPPGSSTDVVELGLRGLEGVEAVTVTEDVVRVQAGPTAVDDLAPRALGIVRSELQHSVVVEVVRVATGAAPRSPLAPISWAPVAPLEILAIRDDPAHAELEVHVRGGAIRTVGRAPLARGLVGAAEATLDAWHDRPGAPPRAVAWARTVEDGTGDRVVVAVALEDPRHVTVAHGIGAGAGAAEAAVRATTDALSR